jgi:hypothetical protein
MLLTPAVIKAALQLGRMPSIKILVENNYNNKFNNDNIGDQTIPVEILDVVLEARRILLFVKVIENHSTTLHKEREGEKKCGYSI